MTPRIAIVCGHYGVGKSEFSVNYARHLAGDGGPPVVLVDLDVVNPYFRAREARTLLEAEGIRVIGNALQVDAGVDLPAIPAEAATPFLDSSVRAVVDLGGNAAGARALRQFRPRIPTDDTEVLFVVNVNRPETRDATAALRYLRAIEATLDLRVTGLVNNSHMVHETEPEHLLAGEALCRAIADRLPGVAVRFVSGLPTVLDAIGEDEVTGERIPLDLHLRSDWMARGNAHLPQQGG